MTAATLTAIAVIAKRPRNHPNRLAAELDGAPFAHASEQPHSATQRVEAATTAPSTMTSNAKSNSGRCQTRR